MQQVRTQKLLCRRSFSLDQLPNFAALYSHVFSVMTGDRASSNDCCEDGFYFETPTVPRLRLTCAPHCISTAQGRTYGSVSVDISGQLAVSLVQIQNSHVFCKETEAVLLASVHPSDVMPDRSCEAAGHRKALLDLSFPTRESASVKRRLQIEIVSPGGFSSDVILWYVPNADC